MTGLTVYEAGIPKAEGERLAADTYVSSALNDFSLRISGRLDYLSSFVDIGCGENTGLEELMRGRSVSYIGYDCRSVRMAVTPKNVKSRVEEFNIRMGFPSGLHGSVVHVRNLIAHLDRNIRINVLSRLWRTVHVGGRLVVIEEDWSSVRGSDAVERLREMLLRQADFFDADYGKLMLERELGRAVDGRCSDCFVMRHEFPVVRDYGPLLALAPVIKAGFAMQPNGNELVAQARSCFERIREESRRKNPPGYRWPNAVGAVAIK